MRERTHLSFEFQGGMTALHQLQDLGAPTAQAESVCEAIIRHQDPGSTGTISAMGCLVQLATEFGMVVPPPFPVVPSRLVQSYSLPLPRAFHEARPTPR